MGGQNLTPQQIQQQNIDRQNAEAAKQQQPQEGGKGQDLIISNPTATAQGLREASSKGGSMDWSQRESEFAASLKNNAGISAPTTLAEAQDPNNPYNNAISNYERGNNLTRDKATEDDALLQSFFSSRYPSSDKSTKQISFSENYGYTNTKPSSIITGNTNVNPLEVNFEPDKGRVTTQARKDFSFQFDKNQGGVETEKSKGKSEGWDVISSNQLTRNSEKEAQTKASEATKALGIYPSTAKEGYATGGGGGEKPVITLGKAQSFFGNKTKFGWNDVSKDQLVRGSNEEKLSTLAIFAGRDNTRIDTIGGTPFKTDLVGDKGGSVFLAAKSGQSSIAVQKSAEKTIDFNTFYSGAESRGSIINVYNAQGAKIGSFKATEENKSGLDSLAGSGVYFREQPSTRYDKGQQQSFRDFISTEANKGETIMLFSGGQKIGEVSGPNAYRDAIQFSNYGNISAKVDYSTTKEGKTFLDVVSKGGLVTFAEPKTGSSLGILTAGDKNVKSNLNDIINKAPSGFSYSILYPQKEKALLNDIQNNPSQYINKPQSFWDKAYQEGKLQTNDQSIISGILHNYQREQNIPIKEQQKQTAAFLANQEYPGNTFIIKDRQGKTISVTKDQRSYYDFLKSEGYGNKTSDIGPYVSGLTITPKYNGTFAEAYKASTEAKTTGKTDNLLSDIAKSAESTGAGMAGVGLSALSFGWKSLNENKFASGSLGENAVNKTNYNKFKQDVSYLATGGYSLTGLTQGRVIQKETPPLTYKGENIITNFPPPTAPAGYVSAGSAFFGGVMIGATVIGSKGLIPLRLEGIPLKVGLTEASPAFPLLSNIGKPSAKPVPMSESLVFGYGANSRELISKVPSGYKYGKLKPSDYFPEGYALRSQATRGEEFATGKAYPVSKLSSEDFQNFAETTGRSIPGTAKATKNFIELHTLSNTGQEYTQYNKNIPISTERITPQVGKSVLETNAQLYPFKNAIIRIFSTGRGAVGQGSHFGNMYTHPEVLQKTEELAPVHDIDFVKGNAISESNPVLAVLNERQARSLASTVQTEVEKTQGIQEQPGVGFHATESTQSARDIISNPSTEESKRGGFFVMNKATAIGQFGSKVLKVEYNTEDVLFYKNIPKAERKKLIKSSKDQYGNNDWLKYQENVINYGKSKGYDIVEKPYYNTKKGAGTNPNATTREIIFTNEESLKSIKNIELLPKMQLTEAVGSKIYGASDKEKLVEFITKSDTAGENPSALKPTGNLLGHPINFKVYKTPIEGSNIKGPHYGGQHAEETGLSQILAFQTSETVAEQGSPTGRLSNLGEQFAVGPKLFGQGKELVRTLGKYETKAIEFKSNPATKEKGERMITLIQEQREYYGNLYGIDFEKPISGSDFGKPSKYYEGQSKISSLSEKGSKTISSSSIFNSKSFSSKTSNLSQKSQSTINSQYSVLSGKSGKPSNKSSISASSTKSGFSGKSLFSSKSTKSGSSAKSILSTFSSTSGPSGSKSSGFSGKSAPLGPSGTSGISSSSLSGLSGISGPSGFNGISITTSVRKIPILKFGQIGYLKKPRQKEGPTAIINLGVRNIFSSILNIEVAKGKRYEF